MTRIWTVGYEGHSPESLTLRLRAAGIERLVDIRELPLSRKPGFSKRALALGLAAAGIEYSHLRALGTPRDIRHAYKATHDHDAFRRDYLRHVEANAAAVDELEAVARAERVALLCVEKDPRHCHRTLLGEVLAARGWQVEEL
ncbi:MAG TPA: DUF488 domain-containing protein [Candidatus Thermoplasmatota archaeon]|nr:DUF488 domain-containing protein [Candidatus Thermoplasmatota archaeon]